jgi:hypothetical protein
MSYGAGATGFPSRNRAALALIFGMHIVALLGWMQQRQPRFPTPAAPQVVSILLRPPAVRPRRPAAAAIPPPVSSVAAGHAAKATAPGPHVLPDRPDPAPISAPIPAPIPAHEPAAPTVPAAVPALEASRAPVDVRQAIREQQEAEAGFALGLSKRQAGRIDRELRKGKSGVPDEPDTPMGRFRRGLEAAHIERSMSVQEDSYTSPDGVITYRKRIGNTTICRRSGSINPLGMRGMLFANEAGDVPCPKGVQWKKD